MGGDHNLVELALCAVLKVKLYASAGYAFDPLNRMVYKDSVLKAKGQRRNILSATALYDAPLRSIGDLK